MKYYKNIELAKLQNVSEKAVRNWIQAALEGKLELQLYEEGDRNYIANTSKNVAIIEEVVQKGKKFRNSRGFKIVKPKPAFYKLYTSEQIFNIISSIDIYREIPHQYSYFDGGAKYWDLYSHKLLTESTPNLLNSTVELLGLHQAYLDNLLGDYQQVNVVDVGAGNGLPVRHFLEHLLSTGKLGRYVGIDLSNNMLDIAERNFKKWFGDRVTLERSIKDINRDRFTDILINDAFNESGTIPNVMLFFGGTIANSRHPQQQFQTVHDSMGKQDLLLFAYKLDTPRSRRYFDFGTESASLDLQEKVVPELLNIDESLYEVEQFFDENQRERQIQIRLKVAISIEFNLNNQPRVLDLNKGDAILLWRSKHWDLLETINFFENSGFDLIQTARSKDQECILLVAKIKS